MDEQQLILEKWKNKIRGISTEPPINYKLIFGETIKNLAKPNYSLLDIGTGAGKVIFSNGLPGLFKSVYGVDIRPEMIGMCRERGKDFPNAMFEVADATKRTFFKARQFDVITSMFAPYDAGEVYRILNDGGYFVVLHNLSGDHKEIVQLFPEILPRVGFHGGFGRLSDWNGALKKAGFRVVSNNTLRYKWVFKDQEILKQFYEKISFSNVFGNSEHKLEMLQKNIDGSIPVTRVLCTTVAKKA